MSDNRLQDICVYDRGFSQASAANGLRLPAKYREFAVHSFRLTRLVFALQSVYCGGQRASDIFNEKLKQQRVIIAVLNSHPVPMTKRIKPSPSKPFQTSATQQPHPAPQDFPHPTAPPQDYNAQS